jgi:hypothetical protein
MENSKKRAQMAGRATRSSRYVWGESVSPSHHLCLRETECVCVCACLARTCLGRALCRARRPPRTRRLRLRENGTFFELSLCSSRACLGKMLIFIYKWLKKCRFRTVVGGDAHAGQVPGLVHDSVHLCNDTHGIAGSVCLLVSFQAKTPLVLEFSLCLSLACLGKMTVFIDELTWRRMICLDRLGTQSAQMKRR